MMKQERIVRNRKLILNPHVSNARKSRAVHHLYDDGVSWPEIRTWLDQGTQPERVRVLDALAEANAPEKQITWAMNRLVATGMPYSAAFVWWMIHHDPQTFSSVFRITAKRMPHVLRLEEEKP